MTRVDRYGDPIEDDDDHVVDNNVVPAEDVVASGPRLQIPASRRSRSRAEIHAHAEELRRILADARARREGQQ